VLIFARLRRLHPPHTPPRPAMIVATPGTSVADPHWPSEAVPRPVEWWVDVVRRGDSAGAAMVQERRRRRSALAELPLQPPVLLNREPALVVARAFHPRSVRGERGTAQRTALHADEHRGALEWEVRVAAKAQGALTGAALGEGRSFEGATI
jgi:hypothetical protein